MRYSRKWLNILTALFIWVGIPYYLATTHQDEIFYSLLFLTWIPACLIFSYLDDEQN